MHWEPVQKSGSELEENTTIYLLENSQVIQLRNLDDCKISEQKKNKINKEIQAVLYLAKNV